MNFELRRSATQLLQKIWVYAMNWGAGCSDLCRSWLDYEDSGASDMSSENRSANSTCRAFVLVCFLMVVCAFLLMIGISEHSGEGIRRHFSTPVHAKAR